MSHLPPLVTRNIYIASTPNADESARCPINYGASSSGSIPRLVRLDDRDFRAPSVPPQRHLQGPPRKIPRISATSLNPEMRYSHHPSNIPPPCYLGPAPSLTFPSLPLRSHEESIITSDFFEIFLDVHNYRADELKVKIIDDSIIVTGDHGERLDNISLISEEFTRKYDIPDEVDKAKISSVLSSDGILCIFGPKINNQVNRDIPIIIADQPATMTAPINLKQPERKFPQMNRACREQTPLVIRNTQAVQPTVLPQMEVLENREEINVPADNH